MRIGLAAFTLLTAWGPVRAQFGVDALSQLRDDQSRAVPATIATAETTITSALEPVKTVTIFDEAGPGEIRHVWITTDAPEVYHLKKIVLRTYWDGEIRAER